MRHRSLAKVFGRRPEPRKALFRGLATALLKQERIETTLAKAKELRRVVEPLVTLAKRGDLHARRQAAAFLYTKDVVAKLFADVGPRFKDRQGGYTRIFKIGRRRGDGAEMALIELTDRTKKAADKLKPKAPKKEKTAEKKETAPASEKKAEAKKATPSKAHQKQERKPAQKKSTGK